ncbi:hypothetical protein LTR37_014718 [Vermiconidia calcicola]|uniref:Uncharacterized protein n=1 Tax=Vermiconidia calcicola TaxID=1690605 RepID=A0ACC3MSN8_9PEZI|nr:hypothetical protein LTR37_014718 [Vermiconidia calcicola]
METPPMDTVRSAKSSADDSPTSKKLKTYPRGGGAYQKRHPSQASKHKSTTAADDLPPTKKARTDSEADKKEGSLPIYPGAAGADDVASDSSRAVVAAPVERSTIELKQEIEELKAALARKTDEAGATHADCCEAESAAKAAETKVKEAETTRTEAEAMATEAKIKAKEAETKMEDALKEAKKWKKHFSVVQRHNKDVESRNAEIEMSAELSMTFERQERKAAEEALATLESHRSQQVCLRKMLLKDKLLNRFGVYADKTTFHGRTQLRFDSLGKGVWDDVEETLDRFKGLPSMPHSGK